MNEKKSEIIFYGNLNGKNIQGYAYSVYGIGGKHQRLQPMPVAGTCLTY